MRPVPSALVALVFLTVAFAGCADSGPTPEPSAASSSASASGSLPPSSSPSASPSASAPPPPAPRELFNESQDGGVELANPVLRAQCEEDLDTCGAAALQEGTDHDMVSFTGVPATANNFTVIIDWTDADSADPSAFDARIFDGDGKKAAFGYHYSGNRLEIRPQDSSAAKLGDYQVIIWVHEGGAGTFVARGVAYDLA